MAPRRGDSPTTNDGGTAEPTETASTPLRRSTRTSSSLTSSAEATKRTRISKRKSPTPKPLQADDDSSDAYPTATSKKKAKAASTATKAKSKTKSTAKSDRASSPPPKAKKANASPKSSPLPTKSKAAAKKGKGSAKAKLTSSNDDDKAPEKASKPRKVTHQVVTDRDEIPKLWDTATSPPSSYTFKIASWNVAGLRAILRNTPNAIRDLVDRHALDVLCLQETKLQEMHLDDPKLKIRETMQLLDDFEEYWSCSTAKKGYSGTAVFIRKRTAGGKAKKQATLDSFVVRKDTKSSNSDSANKALPINTKLLVPENVTYVMGVEKHDMEGRMIMVDMPLFSFCNVYIPNSGQKLERLSYRTEEWDKDFLDCMQKKKKDRPVFWLGDLNVAHTKLEVWNDGAKHLAKQAGVTAQERASFQAQLDAGFVDAFRHLHPTASGHYSYWSQRAGNREPNKGLRLDYFICDPKFIDGDSNVVVRDSYMDYDQKGSDHCPVILELEIKDSSTR